MPSFITDIIAVKALFHAHVTTQTLPFSIDPANHGADAEAICQKLADLGWDGDLSGLINTVRDVRVGSLIGTNTFVDETGVYIRNVSSVLGALQVLVGTVSLKLYDSTGGKTQTFYPTPFTGTLTANRTLYAIDATGSYPVVVKDILLAAQTTVGTITTFTVPAADHAYQIDAYMLVSAISTDVLSLEVDFTDESNTARTVRMAGMQASLSLAPTSAINTTGFLAMNPIFIGAKASTTITVKSILTTGGGSFTADFRALITQKD